MINRLLCLSVVLVLAVVGCKSKPEVTMVAMGDGSPAFGTGDKSNLQSFLVGQWCFVGEEGPMTSRFYNFKADGTFECGGPEDGWKSTGKWSVTGDNATLQYLTMKDKSYDDFRAEYKKDEEGGGQVSIRRAVLYDQLYGQLDEMRNVWVDSDQKRLAFTPPQPPSQSGQPSSDELGNAMANMLKPKPKLERMTEKKE